jgi:hypothetical protein
MSEFKLPSWSARNPLGIVALFISLIYGMSALLLGTSVSSLLPSNQTILVAFIVFFPVVVLLVFGWLVAFHHTKLYGPADYRTDKGFLDSFRTAPSKDVGARLQQEVESAEAVKNPQEVLPRRVGRTDGESQSPTEIRMATGSGRSWQLSRAYLIEGLLFQMLQDELGGAVRREVMLPGDIHVDGIIEGTDGATTVVEIKLVSETSSFTKRIRQGYMHLGSLQQILINHGLRNFRFLLAVVVDGDREFVSQVSTAANKQKEFLPASEIRVYPVQELLARYGFPLDVFEAG